MCPCNFNAGRTDAGIIRSVPIPYIASEGNSRYANDDGLVRQPTLTPRCDRLTTNGGRHTP